MNALVSFNLCKLSDLELVTRVDEMTDEMYKKQKLHSRHIPARPDSDYDLLVGELCKRFAMLFEKRNEERTIVIKMSRENMELFHKMMQEGLDEIYGRVEGEFEGVKGDTDVEEVDKLCISSFLSEGECEI